MPKSESIASIAGALAKAQGEMKNPGYDSRNPHFKNQYASLAAVRDAITPPLAKHGIALTQMLETSDRGVRCETMLLHESGEWISSILEMPASQQNAQGYGSAATYCRRYALMAIVGVVGDEDDDANEASTPQSAQRTHQQPNQPVAMPQPHQAPANHPASTGESGMVQAIRAKAQAKGVTRDQIYSEFKIDTLNVDKATQAAILKWLNEKPDQSQKAA